MPSPTHKTDYAIEALSLLTSRYRASRPFTPQELGPVFYFKSSFGLSSGGGVVSSWADRIPGDVAAASGFPTTAADSDFGGAPSVAFGDGASVTSMQVSADLSANVMTVFVVGEVVGGTGAVAQVSKLTTSDGITWTSDTPSPLVADAGLKIVELAVFAKGVDPVALKAYALATYGVSPAY